MKVFTVLLGLAIAIAPSGPCLKFARGATTLKDANRRPGQTVNLLKLVDPKFDVIRGKWALSDGTLKSLPADHSPNRIQIRYAPGKEYDLRIVVERIGGRPALVIGLVMGGRQFTVDLDGWDSGDLAGISSIDGKTGENNETSRRGTLLTNRVDCTVDCAVREGHVVVKVDGKKIIDWRGSPDRLSLWSGWKMPEPRALFLGCWGSEFHIKKLTIRSTRGQILPRPAEDSRTREMRKVLEERLERMRRLEKR